MGTSRVVLALILGHVDNAVTARYDRHTYWKEQADARLKLDSMIQQELGLMDEEAREPRQPRDSNFRSDASKHRPEPSQRPPVARDDTPVFNEARAAPEGTLRRQHRES
jgi:hypothetical protein